MQSFLQFLSENKAWWITPLVLVLALILYIVFADMGAQPADEPFRYDMY